MQGIVADKYHRIGRCRTSCAVAALVLVDILSGGAALAQMTDRERESEHSRAVAQFVRGKTDITRILRCPLLTQSGRLRLLLCNLIPKPHFAGRKSLL